LPEIGRIQSTNFQSLLNELGIPRANIPFALRSEVTPVVLVGGTVSFLASPTPAYQVLDIFTEGPLVNPAAGAVLADTGQLPAGSYSVQVLMQAGANNTYTFEWRNAGNTADLWSQILRFNPAVGDMLNLSFRLDIANDNERFRILITGLVAATYQGTILARI